MGRPTTLPEPWRSLAERLGSVQALADALHSSTKAVQQWGAGTRQPRGPARALIEALFAQHNIKAPW